MFDTTPNFPMPVFEASARVTGASVQRFMPDEAVFIAGDAVSAQMQIVEGLVVVSRELPDGARQIVDFLEPGDFIEPGAYGQHRLSAHAVDQVKLHCHPLGIDALPAEVMQAMLYSANRQLARQTDHVTTLGAGNAESRLALAMIRFAGTPRDCGELPISLPVNRSVLAEYAGLTTETVSRILSRWKAAGVLRAVTTRTFMVSDANCFDRLARADMC